jgi:transcriptional/translational regulatory protein YebC/TACO1
MISLKKSSFEVEGDYFLITTEPHDLMSVKEGLQAKGFHIEEATLQMVSKTEMECSKEDRDSNNALIEWIENLDDVDEIFHNMLEE